jgi:tRNA A37 threonylcarbamoyladenosine dehydratase
MDSQKKVTESYVVVIGLGGVGSHAASMLLRSGVGRLLLVDFDQVWICVFQRWMHDIVVTCEILNALWFV